VTKLQVGFLEPPKRLNSRKVSFIFKINTFSLNDLSIFGRTKLAIKEVFPTPSKNINKNAKIFQNNGLQEL
jgi:hypothetical protein